MEKNVHGIKGNIYCNSDLNQDEKQLFDVIERIALGFFCVCGVATLIAQIVIHVAG